VCEWQVVACTKALWLKSKAATDACISASQWGEPHEIAPFACHRIAFADRFCPEGVGATGVALLRPTGRIERTPSLNERCKDRPERNWHTHCFIPFKPNPNARWAALVGQR